MANDENFHDRAMNLAEEAVILKLQGRSKESTEKFVEAFELELKAATTYRDDHRFEPTRSVLYRSAASLALHGELFREAEQCIGQLLAGDPPADIADEARNIYEKINFERHLKLKGVTLFDADVQMSLVGNSVSYGMIKSSEFMKRAETFDNLAIRTAERLLGRPFREKGRVPHEIRENFETYYSIPRAASFAITMRVGYQQSQLLLFEDNLQARVISEILENMTIVNNRDEPYLKKRIDNEDYYANTIGLIKKLSPDNREVSMVGLSSYQNKRESLVAFTRLNEEIRLSNLGKRENDEPLEEIVVSGVLSYANANSHDIRLISDSGETFKVIVPRGLLGDLVKPYWEQFVTIKGRVKDTKIYYEDLWKDE